MAGKKEKAKTVKKRKAKVKNKTIEIPDAGKSAPSDLKKTSAVRKTKVRSLHIPGVEESGLCRTVLTDISERKDAEGALLRISERHRSYIDITGHLGWTTNAEGEVVEDIPSWRRYTGQTYEEIKGWGWAKALHPDDLELTMQAWKKAVTTKTRYEVEYRIRRHDGAYRFFLVRGVPVYKEGGGILEWVGTCIDITERKQTEEFLRNSREDLRRAQEVGIIGNWRLDVRLNLLSWSDENYRIFGIPAGTPLTYETFLSSVHPDDRKYVDTQWKAGLRGEDYDIEHRIVTDGRIKWVREKAYLEFDNRGALLGGFGITQDITDRKLSEEAILSSKRDWERTFDTIPDLIMILDKEYRIRRINRALSDRLGISPEKVLGRKCYELMHRSVEPVPSCPHARLMSDGREHIEEIYEEHLGGHFFVTVSPIYDNEGQLEGSVHVARDITELKLAQERLLDSQRLSQQIMESAPNIIFIFDIINDNLVYANSQIALTLGYTLDDIHKSGSAFYYELVHPEDITRVNIHKKQIAIAGDGDIVSVELRVRHADGEWRWIQVRNTVFKRAEDGSVSQVLGAAQDVTGRRIIEDELERYRRQLEKLVEERTTELVFTNEELEKEIAERRLAESALMETNELLKASAEAVGRNEKKFRRLSQEFNTLLNAIPDSIILLSPDLKVLWSNTGSSLMLGKAISEMAGKYCYELWHNSSNPCEECPAARSFLTGETEISQISAHRGRYYNIRAFPVKDESGTVNNVIVVTSDITEKISLQTEAIRAGHLASLGELAAGVAHEINNPINGIINYAQMLVDSIESGSRDNEIAARIIGEGERIANIVKSLLSFARDRKEDKHLVNINDILSDSLALTEAQIRKDGISLTVDLPADLPEIIAHPQQIQQVFLNVINNARYALNQKYPDFHQDKKLSIFCAQVLTDQREYVRATFYDNGTGIPADIIDKVMNPFFTTKPSGKGTGLGLSISHGIITDHEGIIRIQSLENEFTNIIIDLPVREM